MLKIFGGLFAARQRGVEDGASYGMCISSLRLQPYAAQDDCGDGLYRLVELLV